jgi:hypothetical protein
MVFNVPIACDDGDPCTTDWCDPTTNACRHAIKSCSDGNACTIDSCFRGVCVHERASCGADPCGWETCIPATGECIVAPAFCYVGEPGFRAVCDPATGTVTREAI